MKVFFTCNCFEQEPKWEYFQLCLVYKDTLFYTRLYRVPAIFRYTAIDYILITNLMH